MVGFLSKLDPAYVMRFDRMGEYLKVLTEDAIQDGTTWEPARRGRRQCRAQCRHRVKRRR